MKKTLIALSLAAALVSGSAMAVGSSVNVVPLLIQDKVQFVSFNNNSDALTFLKHNNLPASALKKEGTHEFHVVLIVDNSNDNSGMGGSR